jgi:tetratricopeptide (TPR) repeat protein
VRDTAPEAWEPEQWVDEGPLRDAAARAVARSSGEAPAKPKPAPKRRSSRELAIVDEVERSLGSRQAGRFKERLVTANASFERERYSEVKSLLTPVVAEVPDLAMARELLGLSLYRLGRWKLALVELEAHRTLTGSHDHLAVIADCYRALKRYGQVAAVWNELKAASPSAALVAEGRIVMAGALADQGRLREALKELAAAEAVPRRIREHHIRLWYVIGDLYDRSGETTRARAMFQRVHEALPGYADVEDRIAGLGR